MRARIALFLGLLSGCDVWWQGFINKVPNMADGGMADDGATCGAGMSCDLATSPATPDDLLAACSMPSTCPGSTPFCDLNTGLCTAVAPPTEAFMMNPEQSITLSDTYMLMATGDYNDDGIDDVAVSGVFTVPLNTGTAKSSAVEIYLGDGLGRLKKDATCPLPVNERPVFLLTVPGTTTKNDVLVATFSGPIYNCSRPAGGWMATAVSVGGTLSSGFKRLALAYEEGQAYPDLVVRTSNVLFVDGTTGSVDIHRNSGKYSYGGLTINLSTSNVNWVLPYRLTGAAGDSLATTWDTTATHPGIEFHYVQPTHVEVKQGSGNTGAANVAGTKFSEFNGAAFAALTPFRIKGQATPSILFGYSQTPNSVSVAYGSTLAGFGIQSQKTLAAAVSGLILPYAGDANEDGQDEIGLYTMALNGNALTRHLQLLNYKNNVIDTGAPLLDLSLTTENFRAMGLNYLGGSGDRRRQAKRRDLIALIENPSGGSRLLVIRPNLNYIFF